jgi:cobalt-zinc-cadmium efflux system membrane fusion protein
MILKYSAARCYAAIGLVMIVASGMTGCGKPAEKGPAAPANATASTANDHSGWWCNEHGVPEGECPLCNPNLAAGFKAKGDWCEEHNRPNSQCFACNPGQEAVYAMEYEARYGKKPPTPTENGG